MKRGELTEKLILGPNVVYLAAGKGKIVKREQATIWSRKRGGLIPIEKGRPDYSGVWRGLQFELEAKEVASGDKFKFLNPKTLKPQIKYLEENARASGLSFFVVFFCDARKGLREGYLYEVRPLSNQRRCPFLDYGFGLPDSGKALPVQWFRDNALRIYEANGGLDWGQGIQRVVEARAALVAQNGGLLHAGKLD